MDYAKWIDERIDEAISSSDQTRATGKVEAIRKILPYLRSVKDQSERMRCFWRICERLHIDKRLIHEEISRAKDKNGHNT